MKYKTLCRMIVRLLAIYFAAYTADYVVQYLFAIGTNLARLQVPQRDYSYLATYYGNLILAHGTASALLWYGTEFITSRIIPSNRRYCHDCGYDLSHAAGHACPECGTAFRSAAEAEPNH